MIRDIVLRGKFENFVKSWDIQFSSVTEEAEAFEKFVNYIIISNDNPSAFIGKPELLDFCSPGGGNDGKIDGVGIKVNGILVDSEEDINQIVDASRSVVIDFILIQAKERNTYSGSDISAFGLGLQNFFSEASFPENDAIKQLRALKDYIFNTPSVYQKMEDNPTLSAYFVVGCNAHNNEEDETCLNLIEKNLNNCSDSLGSAKVRIIDVAGLKNYCKELENSFSIQFKIRDIIPLTVNNNDRIKKAYAFTCDAQELLKLLEKEDKSLRKSLFNDNVRDYLGDKSAVNTEIENTIMEEPEMFLMCNNGITIVCSDFLQVKDKFIRIDNPQIVNGCQTCSTIFHKKDLSSIEKVQILVKLICTEDNVITNKVVRGTNKQNQVLDESFEATKPFHQEMEEYFIAKSGDVKIYYERRIKQYSSDSTINKYQIVNLRILTQAFTALFLRKPHIAHRHEAKLLQEFAKSDNDIERMIFSKSHSFAPYYICALVWMKFEYAFRHHILPSNLKKYKAQLYFIFTYVTGSFPINDVRKGKGCDSFCDRLEHVLLSDSINTTLKNVYKVFNKCLDEWTKSGKSKFGIKDTEEFTKLLDSISRETFVNKTLKIPDDSITAEINKQQWHEGVILSFRQKPAGWFAFIKTPDFEENVYFDNRGYKDFINKITPGTKVKFLSSEKGKKHDKEVRRYATNVIIT